MTIQLSQGIALLSGSMFDYNNPEGSDVKIEDIAAALANVCRFSGHVHYFYSVAQHAVNTSYLVNDNLAFDALMHDTAEAFTNDLPTPLKIAIPAFKDLEVRIESAMSKRFGFTYPLSPAIKEADLKMLLAEKEYVKLDFSTWDCLEGVELTDEESAVIDLEPMSPPDAFNFFMDRYIELKGLNA